MKRREQRGSNIIEAALVLPLLLFLIFGVVEGGRMLQIYQTMTNAAREGVRFAVAPYQGTATLPTDGDVTTKISQHLASGNVKDPVVLLTHPTAMFNGTNTTYTKVEITVPYKFVYVPLGATTINLKTEVTMRNENN